MKQLCSHVVLLRNLSRHCEYLYEQGQEEREWMVLNGLILRCQHNSISYSLGVFLGGEEILWTGRVCTNQIRKQVQGSTETGQEKQNDNGSIIRIFFLLSPGRLTGDSASIRSCAEGTSVTPKWFTYSSILYTLIQFISPCSISALQEYRVSITALRRVNKHLFVSSMPPKSIHYSVTYISFTRNMN